jgi:hypothetical protein
VHKIGQPLDANWPASRFCAFLLLSLQIAAAVDDVEDNRTTILRDLRGDISIPKGQPRKIRRDSRTCK